MARMGPAILEGEAFVERLATLELEVVLARDVDGGVGLARSARRRIRAIEASSRLLLAKLIPRRLIASLQVGSHRAGRAGNQHERRDECGDRLHLNSPLL